MHPHQSQSPDQTPHPTPHVGVVVIGYNDAAHIAHAVRSALAQGPAVREVVVVDDCSTDGSHELLTGLAATEPRLRVIRRETNSGGCGSPRNTGIEAVTSPYVMFLDSDDELPAGAVQALLTAAEQERADVAAGLCVRRELPSGREVPWQAALYERSAVLTRPERLPALVHDTLCVNKLYRTDFLRGHGIRFPDGRFPYEDFVFTARLLAAGPRMALVPDRVYLWHVRRSADRLSISLDRAHVDNWRARIEASRQAYEILLGAARKELARAARTKFLDHELRMYARELHLRDPEYRRAWWRNTREYLAEYDAADWTVNPSAPGRLLARVILASPEPRDLTRLKELAARPARLCPPYARDQHSTPVWSDDLPQVTLEPCQTRPAHLLPLCVDAALRPRARASVLRLRLHEMYGRVAAAGPRELEVEWRHRETDRPARRTTVPLTHSSGDGWSAETTVDLAALGAGTWDLRLRLRFADGTSRQMTAHAVSGTGLLRRSVVPSLRFGILLAQPYATHSGALAVRVATGPRGAATVLRGRLRRLLP
ncbi:glycosyltransferase family 2 protein [Streptomyces sp. MK5]|uniref:glycosyltransferase family 2 protein n=1 Tax=Streptomyces sp. MK5 TaxID=3064253 RepID=UPI00274158D6|nr:glycosyltransferase family 2 protein [Streptomyces sp. MK5]